MEPCRPALLKRRRDDDSTAGRLDCLPTGIVLVGDDENVGAERSDQGLRHGLVDEDHGVDALQRFEDLHPIGLGVDGFVPRPVTVVTLVGARADEEGVAERRRLAERSRQTGGHDVEVAVDQHDRLTGLPAPPGLLDQFGEVQTLGGVGAAVVEKVAQEFLPTQK